MMSRAGVPANTGLVETSSTMTRSPVPHRRAARGLPLVDRVEKFEERGLEAAAGDDLQPARVAVHELDVPHVRGGHVDGGVNDFEQQGRRVPGLDEPRADLVEAGHRGEIRGELLPALAKLLLGLASSR